MEVIERAVTATDVPTEGVVGEEFVQLEGFEVGPQLLCLVVTNFLLVISLFLLFLSLLELRAVLDDLGDLFTELLGVGPLIIVPALERLCIPTFLAGKVEFDVVALTAIREV